MAASPNFQGLPSNWKEDVIKSNGLSLRIWFNPTFEKPRALYIVHGFGEQSDRYLHFSHYLQFTCGVIAAIDLPGHGLSDGPRGHCEHFEDITAACLQGLQMLQGWLANHTQKPFEYHWMGHSFGGLATLTVLQSTPPSAVKSWIVSAPLLGLSMPVPKMKKFFGELIAPILPRLRLSNELNGASLSKDPRVGEEYVRNPLNHSFVTPRMFLEMNKAMDRTRLWNGPLNQATLFIVPLMDKVVDAQVNFKFVQELLPAPGVQIQMATLPGVCHESFNDLERGPVFNLIENFLCKARLT